MLQLIAVAGPVRSFAFTRLRDRSLRLAPTASMQTSAPRPSVNLAKVREDVTHLAEVDGLDAAVAAREVEPVFCATRSAVGARKASCVRCAPF
jgi:hypothetical protein